MRVNEVNQAHFSPPKAPEGQTRNRVTGLGNPSLGKSANEASAFAYYKNIFALGMEARRVWTRNARLNGRYKGTSATLSDLITITREPGP